MAKKTNTGTMVAVGAATAAAAAAAAGAYWLYGAKDAAKHRKTAKSWMLKARAEVMDAVEKVKDLDKDTYMEIVDNVVKGYSKVAGAQSQELGKLVRDLKSSWVYINQQKAPAKKRVMAVKKSATKVARKVSKRR